MMKPDGEAAGRPPCKACGGKGTVPGKKGQPPAKCGACRGSGKDAGYLTK